MIAFMVFILPVIFGCPSVEKLHSCKCTETFRNHESIICSGLLNDQILMEVMDALKSTEKFYSITIQNSNFIFLPQDIFKSINLIELQIISSRFISLTDGGIAFEGLEDDLSTLIITNSTILNGWDWTVLKNLETLKELRIEAGMNIISEDIKIMNRNFLKDISFENNGIRYVHDTAFSSFKGVISISLRKNAIREVKRSMLPDPAYMLWELDFSHNEIQQLPFDLFSYMPSLSIIKLNNNYLLTITYRLMNEVWGHIQSFDAANNYLRCDCDMFWMITSKLPTHVNVVCYQPLHMKGMSLLKVEEKEIDSC